jgi:hypothetical protein
MANTPQIDIIARDTGDRFTAPVQRTNAALDLARSLSEFRPAADQALDVYADHLITKARSKAKADALTNAGKAFGDAVREGKIEPTQNPWYIQAYNRESAYISASDAIGKLQQDSATWEEQNDSVAFAQRWRKEVGAVGEQYKNPDQQAGFASAEAPATQQTLAGNVGANVKRIKEERETNMASLIAKTIQDVNLKQANNASPDQVYGALEDLRKNWVFTGGTDQQFDMLTYKGVQSAAYNQMDPDLLDVLKSDRGGRGALANLPGVADQTQTDRYHIEQAVEAAQTKAWNDRKAGITQEGAKVLDDVYGTYGDQILRGKVDPAAVVEDMRTKGYSPEAIAFALNDVQRTVADSLSLAKARMESSRMDPDSQTHAVALYTRAKKEGYSDRLREDISTAILDGEITPAEGRSYLNAAISKSGGAKTGDGRNPSGVIRTVTGLARAQDNLTSLVITEMQGAGKTVSADQRKRIKTAVKDAAGAHLALNPGDYDGAMAQAKTAANEILSPHPTKPATPKKTTGQSGTKSVPFDYRQ